MNRRKKPATPAQQEILDGITMGGGTLTLPGYAKARIHSAQILERNGLVQVRSNGGSGFIVQRTVARPYLSKGTAVECYNHTYVTLTEGTLLEGVTAGGYTSALMDTPQGRRRVEGIFKAQGA